MFSVLSKVVDFVLGTVFVNDNDEHSAESIAETDHGSLYASDPVRDQDQQEVLLTAIVDQREREADARTAVFSGSVTQMFSGHGLIDGEVYFSENVVLGAHHIQVGDKVSVVARQQFEDGGWVAESVTVVESTWEKEGEEVPIVATGEVGKVTHFRDGEGIINKNISFDISVCHEGYIPHVGDWVAVELDTSDLNDSSADNTQQTYDEYGFETQTNTKDRFSYAASVMPLREWSFEGTITAAMADHGYVDEEVYFRRDACLKGYWPRKWDTVKVGAIESTQGKCGWRAVSIVPTSRDSSAFKSRYGNQSSRQRNDSCVPVGILASLFVER